MYTAKFVLFAALSMGSIAIAVASGRSASSTTAAKAENEKPVKVPPGYRKKLVKDQIMYCTTTTTLGSRFPKQICVDEDGLQALAELRESNQQDLKKSQSLCASAAACQVQ